MVTISVLPERDGRQPRGGAGARNAGSASTGRGDDRAKRQREDRSAVGKGLELARRNPLAGYAAPNSLAPRLKEGLAALDLPPANTGTGWSSSDMRVLTDKLLAYLELLCKWNTTYNLTAIRDPEQMLTLHLLDSAAIVPPLRGRLAKARHDRSEPLHVIDVGSGAGLPGVVLAVLWPHARVELVEPVGKKAAFLRQVAGELALTNITVTETRIEALLPQRPPDLIVCRAFASLADYATAIAKLTSPATLVAAMKAALSQDEIAGLPPGWRCRETIALRVPGLDAQRHLLLLAADSSQRARPSGDPRP